MIPSYIARQEPAAILEPGAQRGARPFLDLKPPHMLCRTLLAFERNAAEAAPGTGRATCQWTPGRRANFCPDLSRPIPVVCAPATHERSSGGNVVDLDGRSVALSPEAGAALGVASRLRGALPSAVRRIRHRTQKALCLSHPTVFKLYGDNACTTGGFKANEY